MKQSFAGLTLETKDGAPDGTFEGYGAVFGNVDRDGDIVAKGAFAESLKARLPALLWQHNAKEPIGRFDVVREDEKGLYVKGRLSSEGRGREAYDLLKMGALDGLSIGFVTKEAQRSRASGTRTITKADLMEVSLVTFPANEMARISGVKQRTDLMQNEQIEDPRSFERFLRENGFSRSRAKAITAKGFRPLATYDEDTLGDIVDLLRTKQAAFEQKGTSQYVSLKSGQASKRYQFKTGASRTQVNLGSMSFESTGSNRFSGFETHVWVKESSNSWKFFKTFKEKSNFVVPTPGRGLMLQFKAGASAVSFSAIVS